MAGHALRVHDDACDATGMGADANLALVREIAGVHVAHEAARAVAALLHFAAVGVEDAGAEVRTGAARALDRHAHEGDSGAIWCHLRVSCPDEVEQVRLASERSVQLRSRLDEVLVALAENSPPSAAASPPTAAPKPTAVSRRTNMSNGSSPAPPSSSAS